MSLKCLNTVEEGTINWFKFHQINYNYLCHTQNFESLATITYTILAHPNLQFQSTDTKETWKIYEAYTYFFCLINRVPESEAKEFFLKKFKLGKFLNEVPAIALDKKGGNVQILTVQILILLAQKDIPRIIEKVSALKRYARRYLRKTDALFRSDCFINILILLPEGNFHKLGLKRHAKKYIKKLNLVSMLEANQAGEFEIVPFEFLVEILFDLCEG